MPRMEDYLIRFLVGGFAVSAFAVLGDVFKPKSFAGLFGAAPSIALATLVLTVRREGAEYAAIEAQAMLFGAVALGIYSLAICELMNRVRFRALAATTVTLPVWLLVAFGLKWLIVG
jgi:uncharacterized membrane protein (GlpM family)